MALKTNVTGTTSLTTTLLAAGDKVNDIKSILITNVKIDNSLTGFNLYIKVGASSSTLDVLIKNQK